MADAARVIPTPTVPKSVLDELSWRVAQGKVDLPLLPGVAMEVTNVAAQENADARAIAELLRKDQAMAAHVLRVVASPVYSGRTQIVSLQQAVARLGVQKIREISLAIAFRVGVFKLKGFEQEVAALFQHSVGAAMFAQEIARVTRRNVEDAFMCGLLHDVGRPVILQALVQILAEQKLQVPPAAVVAATGDVHCELGGTLADSWGLPEAVEMSIRHHHSEAPPEAHLNSVRITALADELSRFAFEPDHMPEAQVRQHPSLAPLELYPEMLDKVLSKAEAIRAAAGALS
ncbi:MAG TPA: HDOD domain-containing protein [Polyangiaceae bacterium]|nr:HDOD domain-containing protein [Polyangiaceae bacterium]